MKDLKKDSKSARKDFGNAADRGAGNITGPLSVERLRVLKLFLTALVALSVAAVCIENGLHPLALIALLPICAALMRRDYNQPYISSETFISVSFAGLCRRRRRWNSGCPATFGHTFVHGLLHFRYIDSQIACAVDRPLDTAIDLPFSWSHSH